MIGKKINQLATELAPVSTDLTIIGDPVSGVSKKITLAQLGAIFSGAVSFYNDYASFPASGDINVIYCAKDTKKLYLWSGSAYVEVFPSQALLDTYQLRSEKGNANGYASLDSSGKVPISQLPSSIMEYKGTWNAATNTPTLANGTGDTGDVYICNVAGTVNFGAGPLTFAVGDWVIYNGTIWERSSGAVGTVTSVAASITGDAIGITGSPVTTSGTLAFAFAGTGAQYIKGDGTLATFPNTIAQATNLIAEVYNSTGATLTKGTIVYINGGQGNLPTVTKAIATGDSTSAQTFGIVQADITNMNNGYVVVSGRLENIDTQAFSVGAAIYLSGTTAGAFTSTKPYAPTHLVYIGVIVRSHPTQGVIEVKIQNGYELDELHNVAAQTPSNNDGLFYESSTNLWKNKSIATILGYTPQAQLNGTGFVKASGTTISYDNSTYVTTDTFQTISASKTFSVGFSLASAGGTNQLTSFLNTNSIHSGSAGTNVFGFNNSNNIYFGKGLSNGGVITYNNAAVRFYALPDADGTIALVGGSGVGTVTSVGLSSATSGVTIGSSPITTSGTITLAIATASGSQQGLLSSTDWTTFNNKQNALTNPVTGTGTTNYLPKFTGTSTIGNSIVSESGSVITIAGSLYSSGTLRLTGSSSVDIQAYTGSTYSNLNYDAASHNWQTSGGTAKMILNASGNLGLGVTPSAWSSGFTALQVKNASFWSTGNDASITANAYYDGSNYRYIGTAGASRTYHNTDGSIIWSQAPSGTAGNAISFTQAMTLDASGNFMVGNTSNNGAKVVFRGANGVPASSGTTTTAVFRLSSGTGLYNVLDFGTNEADDYSWIQSTRANSLGTYDRLLIQPNGGAVRIGGTGTTSYKLLVDGTLGVTGAATFSSSVTAGSLTSTGDLFLTTTGAVVFNSAANFNTQIYHSSGSLVFYTGASERMRITSGGRLLLGTTTEYSYRMMIEGTSGNLFWMTNGSGNAQMFLTTGSAFYITTDNNQGVYLASGATSWSAYSDIRLKNIKGNLTNALVDISSLSAINYTLKSDATNKNRVGLIAQEVQKVLPEAVDIDSKGMLSVRYTEVIPLLVASIKELKAELDTLKNK